MKLIHFLACSLLALPFFTSCEEDDPKKDNLDLDYAGKKGALVINQGLWGKNNASASTYVFNRTGEPSAVINFPEGSLGDTPQNAVKVDSLVYVATYGTNAVEVFNATTFRKKTSIRIPAPQSVAAVGKEVYAVGKDSVYLINSSTNKVLSRVYIGGGGYAMTIANGNLYINRGTYSKPQSLVTKVSRASFLSNTEVKTKDIEVGLNPYNQIIADESGNVYTVCFKDFIQPEVWKIDNNDVAHKVTEGNFIAVHHQSLFVIKQEKTGYSYKTYSIHNLQEQSNNFMAASNTVLQGISFFAVNPYSGRLYFGTNEKGYTNKGFVYEFSNIGTLLKKVETGYNPYSILFY